MNNLIAITDETDVAPPQRRVTKQYGLWEAIKSHCRRIPLEILNVITTDHDWPFKIIGWFNKRIGLVESVFLVYPATEDYALHYFYPFRIKKHPWKPGPFGFAWQNGKLIAMFAIAATNGMYTDPANTANLKLICDRMEELRVLLGARRKTFAGILPGVLYFKRIIREAPEADLTAQAVSQAIDRVKAMESLGRDTPVIVLGGKGFIGRRVVKMLNGAVTSSIDSADGQTKKDWPVYPEGEKVIVVNITLNNAIKDYIDMIQPGTVVINEVYPEPNHEILAKLLAKGCCCYHVVGVEAKAVPSFPSAYRGAVPCCAAWPAPDMKVCVRKFM